jgi:hypothetical protein
MAPVPGNIVNGSTTPLPVPQQEHNPERRQISNSARLMSLGETSESSEQEQTLTSAKIDGTVVVFPQWVVRAIRKEHYRAAIIMVFPSYPQNGTIMCLMSLTILADKTERLAFGLFGVHLETEGALQCAVYDSGVRMVPRPKIGLQGATDHAILTYLGPEIHLAIEASPIRMEEKRHGILTTNYVTLVITSDPTAGSMLNLNLGLEEAYQLKKKLYR